MAQESGIANYSGTAAQNIELLNKLRSGTPPPPDGSLQGTLPPETPPPLPSPNYPTVPSGGGADQGAVPEGRSLPSNTPAMGSIAAFKDVMRNISRTAYDQGPQISDLLQQYSSAGVPLTNPGAMQAVINRDTSSRSGAIQDMYKGALESNDEMAKQRQKMLENLAPTIYEEFSKNPNVPYQQLVTKYAQQYGIDPLELAGKVITYKTDRDKENLLMEKANLDLLSSKIQLLRDSGATGDVEIPGIGKVSIQKKGDFSLVEAGNSMYIFDKDTGTVKSTGLNTDQLSSNNILDAIQGLAKGDYANPEVVTGYLSSKGVSTSPSSKWVKPPDQRDPTKQIMGYDFTNYATDPKWGVGVSNFLNKIPQIKSANDITTYLQKVSPKSPMIGIAPSILQIAQQNNIDPRLMLAIMGQESNFGVAGRAARTFNVANIGNVDSGANTNWGSWENGVQALAKNINQRVINPKATTTTQTGVLPDKIRTEIAKSDEAKSLNYLKDFQAKLNAYRQEAAKSEGFDIVGKRKSVLDQLYADLKIAYKNAAGLGALAGPDLAILQDAIKPISGITNYKEYLLSGRQKGVLSSIDNALKTLQTNAVNAYDTLISKYSQYQKDPYIKNLGEGVAYYRVKDNATGKIGSIPANEFNPNLYTKM